MCFTRLRESLEPDRVNARGGSVRERFYKIMLVTQLNDISIDSYLSFVEACLKAGVTSVQLREKEITCGRTLTFARRLKTLVSLYEVPLIINDHLWLALEVEADGIYLGQEDISPIQARALLGPRALIGLSIDSTSQLEDSNYYPLDYVGVGVLYPTANKTDVKKIWSHSLLKERLLKCRHPAVGMGGINVSNIQEVTQIGIKGVAMIQGLHPPFHPKKVVKKILSAL